MAGSLIDHVDLRVSDLAVSLAFYAAALEPLGAVPEPEEQDPAGGREIGFKHGTRMSFAIHTVSSQPGQHAVTTGAHVAFLADSREAVQRFHAAAVAHGGTSIGAPGPRPEYGPGYYGAFVLDPDGNNVEAVARMG